MNVVGNAITEKVLEKILIRILSRFTTEHLIRAVENNVDLVKADSCSLLNDKQRKKAQKALSKLDKYGSVIAKRHRHTELNLTNVLSWLKDNNLAFYNHLISNRDAMSWLQRQIQLIKQRFYEV